MNNKVTKMYNLQLKAAKANGIERYKLLRELTKIAGSQSLAHAFLYECGWGL